MSEGVLSIMTQSWPWDSKVPVEKSIKKKDSFRHILKNSARLFESLGAQFFRTNTGIHSGPDAFDESKKTFLANSLMQNSFDAEQNTSGPLLRTQLAICQESREQSFSEVTESFLTSICKFGRFKNPFAIITNLHELYFRI